MCEAAVFCARVTLRLTPHSQPNVFLILSIPHHQSLSSDSNRMREHTHTHMSPCKCVTCIQACAVKAEIVPDAVMLRCMSFTTSRYVRAHFNSPLSYSKELSTIHLFHIDSSVVDAIRKTSDIPFISHPPMWVSDWDTKANIPQSFLQQCLPLWCTAVIGLG